MTTTSPALPDASDAVARVQALPSFCAGFQAIVAERGGDVALRTVGGAIEITWATFGERVRALAAGLAGLGVERGDTVGVMLVNRPEFHLVDTAALHLGATPFSIYNSSSPDQMLHLFGNAGNRVVVTERAFLDRILAVRGQTAIEHVVVVDAADGQEDVLSLDALEATAPPAGFDFDATWGAVTRDDVATLIYTSGTTGPPKGVELTHGSLLAEIEATLQILPVVPGDRIPSYLPSAHIADRWIGHYTMLVLGLQITSVPDPRQVAGALADVRPTVWGAVPRVWEKLKAGIEAKIAGEPDETRRQGMQWAIGVGQRKVAAEQAAITGTGPGPDEALLAEYAKADELVLSKLRAAIGLDQVRWSVSGAAPIPQEVLVFFGAIGIPICELWGMSELSCCAAINPPERVKIGTVGPPVPGLEVRLDDDGEVLVKGPTVMRGYRNQPDKTAKTFTADGWLRTGDVGAIDDEGYLTLIDRKKELMINAAGKNMSPANIEQAIKASSPLIGQAVAIGDARPYNVALIVLDPDVGAVHAEQAGLPDGSAATLAADPGVRAAVAAGVAAANEQLSRVEQIKRFRILAVDWEPAGDELTPTSKLKRKPIAEKYAAEIEALYGDDASQWQEPAAG
ncbi:AMP-binding protein [Patulibacter brassicae]|uniref:Acyl-CoA synthetase n=1 Tax=Patulibacter brassicae TaxID=1705717 RepID=A0ABU4VG65_9ACTN|nr:AMP-binding protein [Patulibacter brassicae]MDX8150788.1 AMP-binding protein [Patulibacter brassicae]